MANATCQPARTLPKFRPRVLHGIHGQRFPRQGAGIHLLWYGGHDPRRGAIWMVLGGWLFCGDPRPSLVQFFGLGTGFAGLILLSVNQTASGTDSGWGILLVLCAAFGWVTGSFLSKKQASETQLSVIQTSGLLMFIGGLQSLVGAAVLGEFSTFSMDSVTPLSAGALLYLVIFGAIIAYTCYFWLLLHTRTVSPFPMNTSIRSSAYSSAGCSRANRWTASSSRPAA